MIRYPIRAVRALGFLKSPFNDIEIYVEDTTCHNMHLFIFRKILGPNVRLRSVNQVGDRLRVLNACKADQKADSRKKLYVVDGDFDWLVGRAKPKLKYLHRLNSYDVENLLLSEDAFVMAGIITKPNDTEAQIRQQLDFKNWLDGVLDILIPLLILYAVANKLTPTIQTIGYSVQQLCTNDVSGPQPDRVKVRARMRVLLREIYVRAGRNAYVPVRRSVQAIVQKRGPHRDTLLSGKRYLLPLLWIRSQKLIDYRGGMDQLKALLASHYDIRRERYLAIALRRAMK